MRTSFPESAVPSLTHSLRISACSSSVVGPVSSTFVMVPNLWDHAAPVSLIPGRFPLRSEDAHQDAVVVHAIPVQVVAQDALASEADPL